jgi:hypothetical protein
MAPGREEMLYVAVDTTGHCRLVSSTRQATSGSFSQAIGYLGQLLEEGWQLVSESPAGHSESSIVLLRRNT